MKKIGQQSTATRLEDDFFNALELAGVGLARTAVDGRFLIVNEGLCRMLGHTRDELHSLTLSDITHAEDRADSAECMSRLLAGKVEVVSAERRFIRRNGSASWGRLTQSLVRDTNGRPICCVTVIAAIAEPRPARTRLDIEPRAAEPRAHCDVLTGLPGRALFDDRLKQAIAHARRDHTLVGVLLMGVDRLRAVNDALGYAAGDRLLQQIAARLGASVRTGDTVARLRDDEFAIVLSGLTSMRDANLVLQKIMAEASRPFQLEGSETCAKASIGMTLYPDDSTEPEKLLQHAETALQRAKEAGCNGFHFYNPEAHERALAIANMQGHLRRALERNEFLLHYQPRACLADGRIVGVEALLRWQHPGRGLLAAAEIVPVLEETGLIVPVGKWVIESACAQVAAWRRAGIEPVPISVNLSVQQFQSPTLAAVITSALASAGIEPHLIELEIAESALTRNSAVALDSLEQMRARGLSVSIDHFGTGHSSLAHLNHQRLHALKIDRSFVNSISRIRDDAPVTRAAIATAHGLGLRVVAEGVETETQLFFLAGQGCDEIQGHYFSRPLPAEKCSAWLREKRRLQAAFRAAGSAYRVAIMRAAGNNRRQAPV